MKPEQAVRTLLGPAADQVCMENRKETGSAHRGPEVRKRTPVEDAAGAGRQANGDSEPKVGKRGTQRSKFIVWLVSLWVSRFL